MVIDSTRVMYAAFMAARWAAPATGFLLAVLDDVLEAVMQQQVLIVRVPDMWRTRLDDTTRHFVFNGRERPNVGPLAGSNEDRIALVRTASTELPRLWSIQSTDGLRALGHVMHNIPEALWHPRRDNSVMGNTKASIFDVYPVTEHWNELSVEMRRALSIMCGLDLESAERMVDEHRE
jgi:hypothetical protein